MEKKKSDKTKKQKAEHKCTLGCYYDYDETCLCNVERIVEMAGWNQQSINDFINGPETRFKKFNFCPFCGEPIDWDKVLQDCLQEQKWQEQSAEDRRREKYE